MVFGNPRCATPRRCDGLRFDRKKIPVDSVSMARRISLLFFAIAVGAAAYVAFDFWALANARPEVRLERAWIEDIADLQAAQKLPAPWFNLRAVEYYGGDAQAKDWLKRIRVPIKTKVDGTHKLEVLLLVWEENGKRGAVVQYDIVDLKTQNLVWELGRTFILHPPKR